MANKKLKDTKGMDTFGVTFTPEKLKALQAAIEGKKDEDVVDCEGKHWLVQYARWLCEYLAGTFMAQEAMGKKQEYKHDGD